MRISDWSSDVCSSDLMAPMTTGKSEMRRRSLGEVEQYLNELLEEHSLPFDFDLVRINEVWTFVTSDFKGVRDLRSRVIEWLKGAAAPQQGRYTKPDGTGRSSITIWSRPHQARGGQRD